MPLAFLVTDIDDLFVLVAFFADAAIRPRHVAIGQYAGIAFLLAVSSLAMLFRLVVPAAMIGLLGFLPLARARRAVTDSDDDPRRADPATTPQARPASSSP